MVEIKLNPHRQRYYYDTPEFTVWVDVRKSGPCTVYVELGYVGFDTAHTCAEYRTTATLPRIAQLSVTSYAIRHELPKEI